MEATIFIVVFSESLKAVTPPKSKLYYYTMVILDRWK